MYNGLIINPSVVGSEEVLSATLMYRNQWMGLEGAPVTQTFTVHSPLKDEKIALGLLVQNEKIGIRSYTNIYVNYGFRIKMGSGKLSLGLRAGILTGKQENIDLETYDIAFNEENHKYFLPNFGLGGYYYSKDFFAGISIPTILGFRSNVSDGRYQIYNDIKKYTIHFHTGKTFTLSGALKMQPVLLVKYSMVSMVQMDVGLNAIYKDFYTGGLMFRSSDALIVMANAKLTPQLRIGLSYDYCIGKLSKYNNGSMEVIIQYRFGYQVNTTSLRNF